MVIEFETLPEIIKTHEIGIKPVKVLNNMNDIFADESKFVEMMLPEPEGAFISLEYGF